MNLRKIMKLLSQTTKLCSFLKFVIQPDAYLNPFPNKPWFLRVCSTIRTLSVWKRVIFVVWEKINNFCMQTEFTEMSPWQFNYFCKVFIRTVADFQFCYSIDEYTFL